MEEEIRKIIMSEIEPVPQHEFLNRICSQYFDYYYSRSSTLQQKFNILLAKYYDETIQGFLDDTAYFNDYVHMSLGHNFGEYTLTPMLDNGGGIYPPDLEIGEMSTDPEYWDKDETTEQSVLRAEYHALIFFSWLAINWIKIDGWRANIVVKTGENNSCRSFFLNDFQFDERSKFFNEPDWSAAIEKFNMKSIESKELLENIRIAGIQ